MWFLRPVLCWNSLGHLGHLIKLVLWLRMCRFRSFSKANDSEQTVQVNRSPEWPSMCRSKSDCCLKHIMQKEHLKNTFGGERLWHLYGGMPFRGLWVDEVCLVGKDSWVWRCVSRAESQWNVVLLSICSSLKNLSSMGSSFTRCCKGVVLE